MTPRLQVGERVFCRAGYGTVTEFLPVGIGGWLVRIALDRGGVAAEVESQVERADRPRPMLRVVQGGAA